MDMKGRGGGGGGGEGFVQQMRPCTIMWTPNAPNGTQ